MRAFAYGNDDRTGNPISGDSLIVFHKDSAAADRIAEEYYRKRRRVGDDQVLPIAIIKQGEFTMAVGGMLVASSYYGVRFDVVE